MKRFFTLFFASIAATVVVGGFSIGSMAAEPSPQTSAPVKYAVKFHEFEGCECNAVCPCVFSSDTTFGDCRGIFVYTFDGSYGTTQLKDVSCALVLTLVGKNMEATMGKWKGVLYLSDQATPAEREAIAGLMHVMMGDAFATLETRLAPIKISRQGDIHDLTVGTVAHLRIHGLKGQNGEPTKILNAPSPLASPVIFCALADVNTYNDGVSSWSFTGRNGFYTDENLSNTK
jgi:hypothetical protein